MANLFPDGQERLEAVCVCPTMQPGDAIIHTRYLFHRTDPVRGGTGEGLEHGIGRYTVRYMPGSAPVDGAFMADGKIAFFDGKSIREQDRGIFPQVLLSEHRG